jgi:hypothetical protein
MCWYVYIATSEPLNEVIFTENLPKTGEQPPPLHFQLVIEEDETAVEAYRSLFKGNYLYYVGSDTGCSCGLKCHYNISWSKKGEMEKEPLDADSPDALRAFIKKAIQKEPLEMYAVYETEYGQPPLSHVAIPIKKNARNDFVELQTRQFYTFYAE